MINVEKKKLYAYLLGTPPLCILVYTCKIIIVRISSDAVELVRLVVQTRARVGGNIKTDISRDRRFCNHANSIDDRRPGACRPWDIICKKKKK